MGWGPGVGKMLGVFAADQRCDAKSVLHSPAAAVSLGSLVEIQKLGF